MYLQKFLMIYFLLGACDCITFCLKKEAEEHLWVILRDIRKWACQSQGYLSVFICKSRATSSFLVNHMRFTILECISLRVGIRAGLSPLGLPNLGKILSDLPSPSFTETKPRTKMALLLQWNFQIESKILKQKKVQWKLTTNDFLQWKKSF